MQVLLEFCHIQMESSQWENLNHLFVVMFPSQPTLIVDLELQVKV
jgi:hypothetical protein